MVSKIGYKHVKKSKEITFYIFVQIFSLGSNLLILTDCTRDWRTSKKSKWSRVSVINNVHTVNTGNVCTRMKWQQKNEFLCERFISEPKARWSEHVPCIIWDEATGPGKLSSSTIPREYHHSSIEALGQRMMGGWGKEGGGGDGKVQRERQMFIDRER